jgi:hypothetical protein
VVVECDDEVEAFLWIEGAAEDACGKRGNWGYGGVEGFEEELTAVAIVWLGVKARGVNRRCRLKGSITEACRVPLSKKRNQYKYRIKSLVSVS